jgi:hypothetical protein
MIKDILGYIFILFIIIYAIPQYIVSKENSPENLEKERQNRIIHEMRLEMLNEEASLENNGKPFFEEEDEILDYMQECRKVYEYNSTRYPSLSEEEVGKKINAQLIGLAKEHLNKRLNYPFL